MKTNKINLSDFNYQRLGYGHYRVFYTSPVTGIRWRNETRDSSLIDRTFGAENPKVTDLKWLKAVCKQGIRFPPKQ